MSIQNFKQKVLNALPRPLAQKLYLLRNYEEVCTAKAIGDIEITLGVPNRNRLWVDRFAQTYGHEPEICEWLQQHLKPNEVFFDVGAAFGFFSALASKIHPSADIHAFEGGWQQAYFLSRNAARNQGNKPWKITAQFLGSKDLKHSLKLDTYLAQHNATPTLLKMDVDGAEYDILKGATSLIKARKTEFLIEIHPRILRQKGLNEKMILDFFQDKYVIKLLPNIREGATGWTTNLDLLHIDDNPYLYIAPEEIARFP